MAKPIARFLLVTGFLLNPVAGHVHAQTQAEVPAEPAKQPEGPDKLTIPDGTLVILRFAQPVVGVPQFPMLKPIEHAKQGDLVQLVMASDVRVNGVVLVKKGAKAQATVMAANVPNRKYVDSGIQLRFDWIKSVNGQEIPIRQKRKGEKSGKFAANLITTRTGAFIPFGWDHRSFDLKDFLREYIKIKTGQQWTVIPTGTRVRAYILGDFSLDATQVRSALAEFPSPNPTASVTIYREKESPDLRPHVICDDKDLGELGPWQYFLAEMDPGKHSCRLDGGTNFDFSVSPGEEFYLHVHHSGLSGKWNLKAEDSATGEDAVTFSEPVPTVSARAPTQPE